MASQKGESRGACGGMGESGLHGHVLCVGESEEAAGGFPGWHR